MSYPSWLVTDEADKQRWQICTSHLWTGGIGDHHEALSTGFPDAPQAVWAQIKKLGRLLWKQTHKLVIYLKQMTWCTERSHDSIENKHRGYDAPVFLQNFQHCLHYKKTEVLHFSVKVVEHLTNSFSVASWPTMEQNSPKFAAQTCNK